MENKKLRFKERDIVCWMGDVENHNFISRLILGTRESHDYCFRKEGDKDKDYFFNLEERDGSIKVSESSVVSIEEAQEIILKSMESEVELKRKEIKKKIVGIVKETCTHQCDCPCHQPGMIRIHYVACCDGQCGICGLFIQKGKMEEHLKECHGK